MSANYCIVSRYQGNIADTTYIADEEGAYKFAQDMAASGFHVTLSLEILVIDGEQNGK